MVAGPAALQHTFVTMRTGMGGGSEILNGLSVSDRGDRARTGGQNLPLGVPRRLCTVPV
jgi:hypothetical protein